MSAAPDLRTPDLRTRAEALGQTLPPLLAEAEMLASTVMMGEHGRRRAGLGMSSGNTARRIRAIRRG